MYLHLSNISIGVLTTLILLPSALAFFNSSLGISFGTSYLTSAYITEDGGFVAVANVETTQAWKDLSHHLLRRAGGRETRRYKELEIREIIFAAVSSILKTSEAKLDQELKVLGIADLNFLSEYGYTRDLLDFAGQILPSLDGNIVPTSYFHNIRKGYQLNTAESLGYPPGTDIDKEDNLLLHIDYQNGLLEVVSSDVRKDTTNIQSYLRMFDYGGPSQIASPKDLEELRTRIKKLVARDLALSHSTYFPPYKLSDYRRIVFSGDASASEFRKIREAITEAIPEFADLFFETGDLEPRWAGAVGAARLAKEFQLFPERWRVNRSFMWTLAAGLGDEHAEPLPQSREVNTT
ncbi:hypothetical protein VTL71DRAFT_5341 [Oculimacula yallundae]|uniref:Actin-like ATPase domain-containing protein n=1 Tax=Oculimacula yallundae TaxID=86028 RepID=A0ABR4C0U0_9HELO